MKKVIILFGKPGAGKGTRLSEFLEGREEEFNVLGVGDLLRKAVKEETEIGKRAKSFMEAGRLVPDEIINKIVIDGIKNANNNVIVDGFPRTVAQAEAMLGADLYPDLVIEFYVDDEIAIERAKIRIVCGKCGETYTTNGFKPPKLAGVCDKCGGKLSRRKDDDVMEERLAVYASETYPVLDVMKVANIKVCTINNTSEDAFEKFEKLMLN